MLERHCVLLEGDANWQRVMSDQLIKDFPYDKRLCCSDSLQLDSQTLMLKEVKTQLGKEYDAIIFDANAALDPNSLAIVMGAIRAGGILILCLAQRDVEEDNPWNQRLRRILHHHAKSQVVHYLTQANAINPSIRLSSAKPLPIDGMTGDQEQALNAIFKVAKGHRRRPLVLSADRGRGKSAVLGIAAAKLVLAGKSRIIVTAPRLSATDTLFTHASQALPDATWSKGRIKHSDYEIIFMAPDALCRTKHTTDLLLVDEAAALPNTILARLLLDYARIVFSTTLHGYEGTGRGFELRFYPLLDRETPGWRQCHLNQAIRWCSGDQLELLSFELLLLNATPPELQQISSAKVQDCLFEQTSAADLIDNELDLRALFGLMTLAHYRTRPSDLKMLLAQQNMTLYLVRYRNEVVATAWLINEGKIATDQAQVIYQGERRIKGQILPQSLISHLGLMEAGQLDYQRIVRIVVHPSLHRRGIASHLIQIISEDAYRQGIDLLGASFGATEELSDFWYANDFSAVRLGTSKDEMTGLQALMVLRSCSHSGGQLLKKAATLFQQQWLELVTIQHKTTDPELIVSLAQQLPPSTASMSDWQIDELKRFSSGAIDMDSVQWVLFKWLQHRITSSEFLRLSLPTKKLLVRCVLQKWSLSDITMQSQLAGKAAIQNELRQAIVQLETLLMENG